MGFLKKITKGVKKVAKGAVKVVKKAAPVALGLGGAYLGAKAIGSLTAGTALGRLGTSAKNLLGGALGVPAGSGVGGWLSSAKGLIKDYGPIAAELGGAKYAYDNQLEGIREQNTTARDIARDANLLSQSQAREQMSFQERMANTAHQREVSDLRAAGLNPILSGTGGMGAASPAGAQGSVQTAPVRSEGDALSSAMQIFKSAFDTMKVQADTNYVREVQTPATQASTSLTKAQTDLVAATRAKTNAETANTLQDTLVKSAQEKRTIQETETGKAMEAKLKQEGINAALTEKIIKSDIQTAAAVAAQAMISEDISESQFGMILTYLDRITKSISPFTESQLIKPDHRKR